LLAAATTAVGAASGGTSDIGLELILIWLPIIPS